MNFIEKVYAAGTPITIEKPQNFMISDVGKLISAVVGLLLFVAVLLAFFFLILGGIQWITSGGDKAGMEAARNKITHAIVGLIIVGAAWAVMILVQKFLGVDFIGGGFILQQPF
jgi:Type IV secretion system pilin